MQPLAYHIAAWKVCGIWHWPDQPHWYPFYSLCYCALIYVLFPFLIGMNLFYATDIYAVIETLCFLPTGLVGIKLWLLIRQKSHILRVVALHKQMKMKVKSFAELATVRQCDRHSQKCIRTLMTLYVCAAVTSYIDVQLTGQKKLMWAMWLPYNFENSTVTYQMALIVQLIISIFDCVVHSSLDSFGATMYTLLGAHLDILSERLQDLATEKSIIMVKQRHETAIAMQRDRDQWLRHNEFDLKQCVRLHQQCLAFSRSMDTAMSNVFLVQFGMSGATMCGSEFQLSVINPVEDFPNFMRAAVYIMCSMGQLFLSCYCASQLTHKSEKLTRCIFNSNWTEQSHKFKTIMLQFMQRSMHPIVPRAGGVFVVGLPIFMSIAKTGYSMFAFMKKLE